MKNLVLFGLLFFSLPSISQNISGLYSGTLQNDSAKTTQQYELALSEYRGKITGYAYATFIKNDTFYYSIRRVKAVRDGAQLVVEDEAMLANNFPVRPDKGVRRISYIPLHDLKEGDTLTAFSGNWKTTQTKTFYSVPGTLAMKRESDSAHSALVAHLRELNLIAPQNTLAATHKEKTQPAATASTEDKKGVDIETSSAQVLKKLETPAVKPEPTPAMAFAERKKPAPQQFDITSDSLMLYIYDNGVVDGDVISVYANGENVVAHAKLLGIATKKTIHLPAVVDSVEVLLVAETLGSIPPNTGLVVVRDGSARYDVHFSADMQTNAAIVFRKRKP
jgi:hypothetical protein